MGKCHFPDSRPRDSRVSLRAKRKTALSLSSRMASEDRDTTSASSDAFSPAQMAILRELISGAVSGHSDRRAATVDSDQTPPPPPGTGSRQRVPAGRLDLSSAATGEPK